MSSKLEQVQVLLAMLHAHVAARRALLAEPVDEWAQSVLNFLESLPAALLPLLFGLLQDLHDFEERFGPPCAPVDTELEGEAALAVRAPSPGRAAAVLLAAPDRARRHPHLAGDGGAG